MIKCPGCGEDNPPKFRLCGYCGTPLAGAPAPLPVHEVRKTVTIVFCDLKGSTALGERLDSEALHEVKERYFGAMAAEITRHGGKIEKYIGDAIMAVFGLPRAHEDDALRAVRAAAGMRDALVRVNEDLRARYGVTLANRTGVNTGEVVANDDPTADQKLATGDAVNVAARLEQAAPDDEIYLGEITYRLVRDAVDVEAVAPLELKGKAQGVPAFRLRAVRGPDGNSRRSDTPIVGRAAELQALDAAFAEAVTLRATRLVSVIGDAGVGKSRLVHEAVARCEHAGARVLRGRCLAYGDGITFWPLRNIIGGAAGIVDDDAPDAARAKLEALVGDADAVARLASMIGLSTAQFPLHDLFWAVRRFLQGVGASQPVVAVIDDIHWAEPALLDLLEQLLDTGQDAPVLLLATARPDLFERRPQWAERPGAVRLVLRPLANADAAQVVLNLLGASALPPDVLDRIVGAAEGNPLYVEQMLSMLVDSGQLRERDGQWERVGPVHQISVPPTIQALLEARLDQLERAERAAVEPASVIGLEFSRSAVQSLAPSQLAPKIDEQLASLARKQFVEPSETRSPEAVYRFHHHLVRDTVYGGLLKRARATLHADFVRWADQINADRDRALEFEEILGYHLEQAHRYLSELGPLDAQGLAIGVDGAGRLARAGHRAFDRGDMHAAENLLRRAAALLPAGHANRAPLLPTLGEVLTELGRFDEARTVLAEAEAAGRDLGRDEVVASARLIAMLARLFSGEEEGWSDDALALTDDVIPGLEARQADDVLATAWRLVGFVHGIAGRYGSNAGAVARSMAHARRAGNRRLAARGGVAFATSALFGPTPVPEAIAQCERVLADGVGDRQAESVIQCKLAQLRAMNGEFEPARRLYRQARGALRELGQGVNAAATALDLVVIELLAGDLAGAEREVRADYEFLSASGESFYLSTMAALLARLLREQGRDDEALALTATAEQAAAADDVDAQVLWRSVRAPIVARAGDVEAAEALAQVAVELAARTESPILRGDAFADLAAVLRDAGRTDDARAAFDEAVTLYAAKGDIVSSERARAAQRALGGG